MNRLKKLDEDLYTKAICKRIFELFVFKSILDREKVAIELKEKAALCRTFITLDMIDYCFEAIVLEKFLILDSGGKGLYRLSESGVAYVQSSYADIVDHLSANERQ